MIDDPPEIRRAIGALVYEHLIAQKFNSSQSHSRGASGLSYHANIVTMSRIHPDKNVFSGDDSDSSEVHLGRMLQILREFSTDQILSTYVIDDVWEYMDAMKVCSSLLVNCWGH